MATSEDSEDEDSELSTEEEDFAPGILSLQSDNSSCTPHDRRKTLETIHKEIEADDHAGGERYGLFDLICIGIGSCVGSGVFVLSGQVLPIAGPSACLSWVAAGLACYLSALAYMELSARLPTMGSCYTFSYHGLGEFAAILGSFCITLEYGVSGAGVARNWSQKLGDTLGASFKEKFWFYFSKSSSHADDHYFDLSAGGLTLLCILVVMAGTSVGKPVINTMTVLKVTLILFMIIAGLCVASHNVFASADVFFPHGVAGTFKGTTKLFFGFIGFDEVCCLASKAKDPSRTMPRALLGTLAGAALISTLAQLSLASMVPAGQQQDFREAFTARGMAWAGNMVNIGELIVLPLVVLLSILPQPEVTAAMSRDGLVPSIFRKQSANGAFVRGTAIWGIILTLMTIMVPFSILWDIISLGVLLSFNLTNASLINMRYGNGGRVQSIRAERLVRANFIFTMVAGYGIWQGIFSPVLHRRDVGVLALVLGAVGAVLAVVTVVLLARLEQLVGPEEGIFHAPGVPYIPTLAIFVNSILMADISWANHAIMGIMFVMWMLVYIIYGAGARRKQTLLADSAARNKEPTNPHLA